MHLSLVGIDDQDLVDVVLGVEPQLVPAPVFGRDDLYHERGASLGRRPEPRTCGSREVERIHTGSHQTSVGHAVVVRLAEVEDAQRHQTRLACRFAELHSELSGEMRMASRRNWHDVVDALPHLVEHILPSLVAPLEQSLDFDRLGVTYQRRHPRVRLPPAAKGTATAHGTDRGSRFLHSSARRRRCCLRWLCRRLASSRRSRAAGPGRVARRGRGCSSAVRSRWAKRGLAISRLRS